MVHTTGGYGSSSRGYFVSSSYDDEFVGGLVDYTSRFWGPDFLPFLPHPGMSVVAYIYLYILVESLFFF